MGNFKTRINQTVASGDIADFLAMWLTNEMLPEHERGILFHYYRSYRKQFGLHVRTHYRRQTLELIDAIASRNNPVVLEVGCGCGTESLWAAINGAEVTGIDISADFIRVAKARAKIIEDARGHRLPCVFRCQSILEMERRPVFDIVWIEQALHHMEPRRDIVKAIAAIVKDNGLLIISEANAWNPLLQAALFKRRGFRTIKTQWGHPWGDERIFTPGALSRFFRSEHISQVALNYFRVFPNLPLPGRLMLAAERLVPPFAVPLFTHYNWVATKIPKPPRDAPQSA